MRKTLKIGSCLLAGALAALNAQAGFQGYMTVHLCTPGSLEGVNIGFAESGSGAIVAGNLNGGFCWNDELTLYTAQPYYASSGTVLFPEGQAAAPGNPPLYFSPPWFTATVGTVNLIFNSTALLNDNSDSGGAGGPPCPGCCESGSTDGSGNGPDGIGNGLPDLAAPDNPAPIGFGMPVWRVSEPYLSLWLFDEPLGYQPGIGSRVSLKLAYKQREANAGINPNIFSVGQKWNFSWLSYVTLDQHGSNLVCFPSGGAVIFEGPTDYLTNTRLTGNMTNGYYLYYPDGSTDIYGCIVNGTAFLTQHLNPQSQTTKYNYLTNSSGIVQLQTVVDGSNGTNVLYYGSGNPFSTNLISKVTDRYGRSVNFLYNSNGCLTNIVDVGGISSSLFYDTHFWITNLQTPYGVTSFNLVDTPSTNLPPNGRSVLVTDPDGSSELYLAEDSAPGVPSSYAATPSTSPLANEFDNTNLNVRNTFHWGKKQYTDLSTTNISNLTSNDFAKARMQHWLLTSQGAMGQTLSLERDPSPDAAGAVQGQLRWYDYAGKTNAEYEGTQFLPLLNARVLPDGTTSLAWTARNTFGAVTTNIGTYSAGSATALRTNLFSYATNLIDLVTLTNALNVQTISNAFNTNHQILTNYDALSQKTVFTYDSSNRLTSVTSPALLVTTNVYGADGYLAQQIDIGFRTNSYIYSNGLVYSRTDPRNLTYTNTWDNLQRLTSRTYGDNTFVSNQYTYLDVTASRDQLGNWTYYGYDPLRRIIAATNSLGHYVLFNYCLCGALESMQDALGYPTAYGYDNQSRLTNVLYPDLYSVTYSYNLLGQLTNITDSTGISVTNAFNNQGLLTNSSAAAGQVKAVSYDVLDRVTNAVNANGVKITTSFDSLNRALTRGYPDGGVEQFGYSAFGLSSYTNQLTNVTHYAYDAALRTIAETNALTNITQYGYSPANDLVSLTDQNSHTTQWSYDLYGRVTNKVDATGATIMKYQYDADNRLTNRWSIAKSNTVYAYDAVGNLTDVTYYHTNHLLSFAYDNMNQLTSMSDGIGTTTFSYTPAGQLASESGPWPNDTVSYNYTGRLRMGLNLQQPNSSSWVQTYNYDLTGRMTSLSSPAGTFTYTYNPGLAGTTSASSLIANIALPNGAFITNTYDNNARMLGTFLYNSSVAALDSSVYSNNVGNQRLSVTRAGENTGDYMYDQIGQVISDRAFEVSGGGARWNEQLQYAFDPAGNLTYRTNNTLIENFQVNSLNELTGNTNGGRLTVKGTATSQNSTTVTVNGTNATVYGDATFAATNMPLTTTYTASASDSYGRHSTNSVSVSIATNNASFRYDSVGNLTNDGLRSFAYDDENQLIQVWVPNQWFSQFTYDAKMRRRIRQEFAWQSGGWVQTNEVFYVYDGNLVIQERNLNNLPTTTYTRGLDLSGNLEAGLPRQSAATAGGIGGLLSMTLNFGPGPLSSNSYFYHSDGNGNVTMLINASQAVAAKYLYDAFGNILAKSGSLADANLYRFSSKEAHLNSGLTYYLYRYYDPSFQRWCNRDPMEEAGGINLYTFVGNRAPNATDLFGLLIDCDALRNEIDELEIRLGNGQYRNQQMLERRIDQLQSIWSRFCWKPPPDDPPPAPKNCPTKRGPVKPPPHSQNITITPPNLWPAIPPIVIIILTPWPGNPLFAGL